MLQWVFTLAAGHARLHLLCAWSLLGVVMGSSSLLTAILSRLSTSPVRTQLTLIGPSWGPRSPHPKSGVLSHRIRTHSPFRVRNTPLARIQGIHLWDLSWPPFSSFCFFYILFLLWDCDDYCARLLSQLLPGLYLLVPDFLS
jgi:hypothetical protein